MTTQFTIGNRVRCVSVPSSEGWAELGVRVGWTYTVSRVMPGGYLGFVDIDPAWSFTPGRFVLDEPAARSEAWSPKVGDLVRVARRPSEAWCRDMFVGREFVVAALRESLGPKGVGPSAHDDGHAFIPLDCLEPAVQRAPLEAPAPPATMTPLYDREKYAGIQSWPSLESRIAAARAELDRPTKQRFPSEGRSDRVTSYRRWP